MKTYISEQQYTDHYRRCSDYEIAAAVARLCNQFERSKTLSTQQRIELEALTNVTGERGI